MDEKVRVLELFGIYGKLLTEKQRDIVELYFGCDLSLGEIAEIKNISRQSVSDAIKTAKTELENYESAVNFLEIKTELLEFSKKLDKDVLKRISEIVDK